MALAAVVIFVGCQNPAHDIRGSGSLINPCADRLHDIAGHLLLYYSLNKRLPRTLDDLRALGGSVESPSLDCPVSGKPYIYRPEGLKVQAGRLVLYDAVPIHSAMRWGIIITEPKGDGPLAARVILLPERMIHAAELQTGPETGISGRN